MNIKGIRKRWMIDILAVTIAVLLFVATCFSLIIRAYFYNGIKHIIFSKVNEISNVYKKSYFDFDNDFKSMAKNYVKNFSGNRTMDIMVFNENNEVVISSSGFLPSSSCITPDYDISRNSEDDFGFWEGKSIFGEKSMAATRCIYDENGNYMGPIKELLPWLPFCFFSVCFVSLL